MQVTQELLSLDPFDFSEKAKQLFVKSFSEVADHHYRNNQYFRKLWQKHDITPGSINDEISVETAPSIMVNLFKEFDMSSVPENDVALVLTSSGTGGRKSKIFLNEGSLARVKRLAFNIHKALGMAEQEEANYLCFSYDPKHATDLGTSFTDDLLTSFTPRGEVFYTFMWDDKAQKFYFNEPGTLAALERFEESGKPVRILGLPAYLYRLLKSYPDLKFNFGNRSWLQTGGGWKSFADEEIPKETFRLFIEQRLGIPAQNVRDMFGMVEHGIPYVDCELGQLHIPNYARVFIRDPFTLKRVPDGTTGLIHFCCTYVDSYPSISLLTTDWGSVGQCSCKLGGFTLNVHGRAGNVKHKGCALTSIEMNL
ncbi:MAG: hypothetical protein V4736_03480 [Bdellovibrionota bacterium]